MKYPIPHKSISRLLIAFLLAICGNTSAQAQTEWSGDTSIDADWFTGTNWDNGVPTNLDTAEINAGSSMANPVVISGGTAEANIFRMGFGGDDHGYLSIQDDFNVTTLFSVARTGSSTVTHSDGDVQVGTDTDNGTFEVADRGADGTEYTMTSGGGTPTLTVGTVANPNGRFEMGRGDAITTFNQEGGAVTVWGNFFFGPADPVDPGNTQTYNMTGGTLDVSGSMTTSRGAAIFNQSSGTTTIGGDMKLGADDEVEGQGTYTISNDATLSVTGVLEVGSDQNDRLFGVGTVILDGSGPGGVTAGDFILRNTILANDPPEITPPPSLLQGIVDAGAIATPTSMLSIHVLGDVTFDDGSLLLPEFGLGVPLTDGTWTLMTWDGNLINNGLELDSSTVAGWSFEANEISKTLTVTYVVPEPSALVLLLGGIGLLSARRRR